jgi:TonB family protein
MTANYSSAARTREYQPTILDTKPLLNRLAMQAAFARSEFKRDPRGFAMQFVQDLLSNKKVLVAVIVAALVVLLAIDNAARSRGLQPVTIPEPDAEVVVMDIGALNGNVGFNVGTGQGSASESRSAQGGGGGGDGDRNPPQRGELPPPSMIPAAIPIAPPVHTPALPAAGIDIDPALWKDLKAPVYGDPRSTSDIASKGPGEGEGIGSNRGTGIGDGNGNGVGSGSERNIGGEDGQNGCRGYGTGTGDGRSGCFSQAQVDQRARLISKPEPQYSEEARRNQITGRVLLRAVFASSGEVVEIRAVDTLPFGLTEKAIAAARQIKFLPAMKNGHAVSVYMNLEYNFNLY